MKPQSIHPNRTAVRVQFRFTLAMATCILMLNAGSTYAQLNSASTNNGLRPAPAFATTTLRDCGDALSDALRQNGEDKPCWADIRTVDHWNTMSLGPSADINSSIPFTSTEGEHSGIAETVGGFGSYIFDPHQDAGAYAGMAAVSGYLKQRHWQMAFEDGGALGDFQQSGAHMVGLNRAALRFAGTVGERWGWQASATNSYGNDLVRLAGPLDYRTIGSSEVPVPDTVAYGLHTGNVVDEQEDAKLTYKTSRKTTIDVAAAHTLRNYSDDGVTVQTERGRAELLHAWSPDVALGVIASGAHQAGDGFGHGECSLGGGGLISLLQWGPRASVSLSGSINGATGWCGKQVQFTGDLSAYLRVTRSTDFYLSANRDLSDGVVQNAAFLSSAGAGLRHHFSTRDSLRLSAAAIHSNDYLTNAAHTGLFGEAASSFALGAGFLQEVSYRHYQVSNLPGGDNRNLIIATLWWSPGRSERKVMGHR